MSHSLRHSLKHSHKSTPWLLWPIIALWKLLTGILEITGRLVAVIIGSVLMLVGLLLSLTIIGAIIGIPVGLLGLMLVVRGIF